jgi:hypothetical protein
MVVVVVGARLAEVVGGDVDGGDGAQWFLSVKCWWTSGRAGALKAAAGGGDSMGELEPDPTPRPTTGKFHSLGPVDADDDPRPNC